VIFCGRVKALSSLECFDTVILITGRAQACKKACAIYSHRFSSKTEEGNQGGTGYPMFSWKMVIRIAVVIVVVNFNV